MTKLGWYVLGIWLAVIGVSMTLWAAVFYVIAHFIGKWW